MIAKSLPQLVIRPDHRHLVVIAMKGFMSATLDVLCISDDRFDNKQLVSNFLY